MIGVSKSVCDNVPRLCPAITAFVQHYSHQLGNSESRVSIINMYGNLFVKIVQCSVYIHMTHYYVTYGSGAHKILLTKSQGFSVQMVVIGVKHLCKGVSYVVSSYGVSVVAAVEGAHIEAHALCAPKAQL